MKSLGGGSGKVQTVTFTDEDGNKVPMERAADGSWKPIVPEGMESAGVGPAGLTWDQAEERAKAMASEKAGLFSRDKTDFGEEGRQGFITRVAQELYQGQGLDTAQGQPAPQTQARSAPQQPQIDQATVQRAMGNPDAMRAVLRQLNPGASPQEIEAGVAAALKSQPSGNSGLIQR
jgi:hypothetical protein